MNTYYMIQPTKSAKPEDRQELFCDVITVSKFENDELTNR